MSSHELPCEAHESAPELHSSPLISVISTDLGRQVGCKGCAEWMVQKDHALCHCEVASYDKVEPVLAALRAPPKNTDALPMPPGSVALGSAGVGPSADSLALCARCAVVHCAAFRPVACELSAPAPSGGLSMVESAQVIASDCV